MRLFAQLLLLCLLCFSCSKTDGGAASSPELPALRERLKQNFAAEDRPAALTTAVELLDAGETDADMLIRMALVFEGARRPDALIRALERLLAAHAKKLTDPDLNLRLWMGFGRACGLSGQAGPFLATWAGVRDAAPVVSRAADRGLVALLDNARAAGRSDEFRAKFEAAEKSAAEFKDVWRTFLPLLGSDRLAQANARGTEGPEAVLERVIAAAAGERFEDAKQELSAALAAMAEDAPEREALLGLIMNLDIAAGHSLDAWLANPPQERDAIVLRGLLGRTDEALGMLKSEQLTLAPALRRQLHLKLLREASRSEEALALIDSGWSGSGDDEGMVAFVRARVLLELGRIDEAVAVLTTLAEDPSIGGRNPIVVRQTLAIAQLLSGQPEAARRSAEAATRIFPVNPGEVEEAWGPAVYLLAPDAELAGIASTWTRFPRFKDNDLHFHAAMRALLLGDRSTAQAELQRCISKSIGGEYPCRLAESALRSPALQN